METLMTIEEISELLRVPPSWIYGRTAPSCPPGERLPHLKLGRHLRFERAKVVAWMEKHERNGHEASGTQPEGGE
jgi:hypothetical protein